MVLSNEFIKRKIKLIQEDLEDLSYMQAVSHTNPTEKRLSQYSVERILERIIMRAIDINSHIIASSNRGEQKVRRYEDTFHQLAEMNVISKELSQTIAPSAGLRNRIAHAYDTLDPEVIIQSAHNALQQYSMYCHEILKWISRSN